MSYQSQQVGLNCNEINFIANTIEAENTDEDPTYHASVLQEDASALTKSDDKSQISSLKRKRSTSGCPSDPITPNSSVPSESKHQVPPLPRIDSIFTATDGHVDVRYPKPSTPTQVVFSGKDRVFIEVAQILADQAVSRLALFNQEPDHVPEHCAASLTRLHQSVSRVGTFLAAKFQKSIERCNLEDLAFDHKQRTAKGSLEQWASFEKMHKPLYSAKPPMAAAQSIFRLHFPYVRVQRTGRSIDVDLSALKFWEELSLAPSHGTKHATALCLYPLDLNISRNIATYLEMVQGAYQTCNLGTIDAGPYPVEDGQILPALSVDDRNLLPQMATACSQFGKRLAEQRLQCGNTIIYMINSYGEQALPILCEGFLKLFESYSTVSDHVRNERPDDLILQIVPSDLIYRSNFITLPSPLDYQKLAFETYDRCAPVTTAETKQRPRYYSAPATRLAKVIPKVIDLRLTADTPNPILQSDNCLHIAYAWNAGDRWLTASWTDNLGVISWNACYCCTEVDQMFWQSFSGIAKEIWDTTCDLMRQHNAPWRLFLCKDSTAHREELNSKWTATLGSKL